MEKILRREEEIDLKGKKLERENEIAAKELLLKRRQNVIDSEEKKLKRRLNELAVREIEVKGKEIILAIKKSEIDSGQRRLDMRNSGLDSKERYLEKRGNMLLSLAERLCTRENELHMREIKLVNRVKELKEKKKILDLELKLVSTKNFPEQIIQALDLQRSGTVLIEDGVETPGSMQNPIVAGDSAGTSSVGLVANIEVLQQHGLYFEVAIAKQHRDRTSLTIPASFVALYDLRSKKAVILLTDEGSFDLEVKYYPDPRVTISRHVVFSSGWREFYHKNRLTIGVKCVFKLKKENVNGDASKFAMDVSILGRR